MLKIFGLCSAKVQTIRETHESKGKAETKSNNVPDCSRNQRQKGNDAFSAAN